MKYQAGLIRLWACLALCVINMASAQASMAFQGNDAGPAFWYASTFKGGTAGYKAGIGTYFWLGVPKRPSMPAYFSPGVTGADFTIDVGFWNLNAIKPFTFHALIDNTWNAPDNAPDTVALNGMPAPFVFTSGWQFYRFSVLGFSRNGGVALDDSFKVSEEQFIKAGLYGHDLAATNSVPIPAALWLFGSGLAGIGLAGIGTSRRLFD
jgi:hypothetical protein